MAVGIIGNLVTRHFDFSGFRAFSSQSIREVESHVSTVVGQHELWGSRDAVAFRHMNASFGGATLRLIEYDNLTAPVNAKVPGIEDCYMIGFPYSGGVSICTEEKASRYTEGSVYAINPRKKFDLQIEPGFRGLFITINKDLVEKLILSHTGTVLTNEPIFENATALSEELFNVVHLLSSLSVELGRARSPLKDGFVRRHAESLVASAVLNAFPHNYSARLLWGSAGPAPYYVKKAETYVTANFHLPLTIGDLAAESGVSQRTLHDGFRKFRSCSPMKYVTLIRLEAAHCRLQAAQMGSATVGDIAWSCGFTHLSKFAKAYFERFGCLPSHTLRFGSEGPAALM